MKGVHHDGGADRRREQGMTSARLGVVVAAEEKEMTAASGPIAILIAIAWFAVGAYGVTTFFRWRSYVDSLPPTPGNLRIKRQHRTWLIVGIIMIGIGAWNTFAYLFNSAPS
jgi:hypothetical protein